MKRILIIGFILLALIGVGIVYNYDSTEIQEENIVQLIDGYAGGVEAHKTPSGYVPPPTATIIAQQEDIAPPEQLEITKPSLTLLEKYEQQAAKIR